MLLCWMSCEEAPLDAYVSGGAFHLIINIKFHSAMKKTFISLAIVIPLIAIAVALNFKRLQFEYYTWNLSWEDLQTREEYAEKITSLGNYAVPLLIGKLDHPSKNETDAEIICLEVITHAKLPYDPMMGGQDPSVIQFWKKWWAEHHQKYE
jgi:hypothetical protein